MNNSNTIQQFHSGFRLKKLRELQGISINELATELAIKPAVLESWEKVGIPNDEIIKCYHYFEVSNTLFNRQINNQAELTQLVQHELFPQETERLQELLQDNHLSHSELLDLSSLSLYAIPEEVFNFTWLKKLNLSDNKLKQISSQIILLQKLEVFDISNNFFDHIPGVISTIQSLKKLNFQGNPLLLQSKLLHSEKTLDIFQNNLVDSDISVVIFDSTKDINFKYLDDVRYIVEQTQSLIISKIDKIDGLSKKYKGISCAIYIADSHDAEQLAIQVKQMHLRHNLPLVILFSETRADKQKILTDKFLLQLLPDKTLFYKLVDNVDEFTKVFIDIKQRIKYQKSLSIIKVERLILNNIGVYENLDISFNPELTVLIGLNGTGKTTILKALTLAILGPKNAEIDTNDADNLLRITGKNNNKASWKPEGSIKLYISINGDSHQNIINLSYNSNHEKIKVKGDCFSLLFDSDNNLINLMLGIGEQRNTILKKSQNIGLEVLKPKTRDLLPLIKGEEQACIAHFTSWLGNLALSVSQGETNKQQIIDISFEIFSSLMQESIQFSGLTKVDPLELWIKHQNPEQIVPLRFASQGYQAVMGWVGHIIQRMFEAYADTIQPLQQHTIIFIDEIDQLLHVKWQHKIINVLAKQFFPNTQWIITTHSPMVVAGLDQEQVLQLHQKAGKLVAEANNVDLWLWQYGDVVRFLFEVSPEKPKEQEKLLLQKIEAIGKLPFSDTSPLEQDKLAKLQTKLERVKKSRAFIDELYAEQQKLQSKEKELTLLIEKLSKQQKL